MKNHTRTLIATGLLLLALKTGVAAEEAYKGGEFSLDILGTSTIGQRTIDNLNGARIRRDMRLGAGVGMTYFATRNLGVSVETYAESLSGRFLDDISVNGIFRFPIGETIFAPFVLAGVGRQFDPSRFYHWQLGGGIEFRLSPHLSLITDVRYVLGEAGNSYGLGRGGVRFTF